MKRGTSITFVVAGLASMLGGAGYLTARFNGADRTLFLPGATSHGHYQIELACNACHDPGQGVPEQRCLDCHASELKAVNDSHPKSKFTDPRNADRLQRIDAGNCVTCHREHRPATTRAMSVTMPEDYCYHCHQQTLTDRPSHRDFPFTSCATAGCHNYHDNTALYEAFLVKHGAEPDFKQPAERPPRNLRGALLAERPKAVKPALTLADANGPANTSTNVLHDWAATAHAGAGVNCTDCHQGPTDEGGSKPWVDRPGEEGCASCHREETSGFLAGHHGMRLAQHLTPMTPAQARLPMKADAAHREVTCAACHGAHAFDTRLAAVDACLACHDDPHSRAYRDSPHFAIWRQELMGAAPVGSGVSCSTCHLPREREASGETTVVRVQHNQNDNLRPNEKMIRSVCLDCHGLAFALDALADPALIQNNFNGRPAVHIASIDLAQRRQLEKQKPSTSP